jgi:hypothetical protein
MKKKKYLSNKKINKKKIETKTSALNIFNSRFMRSRRSNIINQMNMSKKHMLEESSINDNSDFFSRNNPKKNSCTNKNMLINSKFTFLQKLSDFEKNGFEFLNNFEDKSKDNIISSPKKKREKSNISDSSDSSSESKNNSSSSDDEKDEKKSNYSINNSKFSIKSNINNIKKNMF